MKHHKDKTYGKKHMEAMQMFKHDREELEWPEALRHPYGHSRQPWEEYHTAPSTYWPGEVHKSLKDHKESEKTMHETLDWPTTSSHKEASKGTEELLKMHEKAM